MWGKLATWLALLLGILGLAVALLFPAGCLIADSCEINAGTLLGVGIAGAIGGALMVFWWVLSS